MKKIFLLFLLFCSVRVALTQPIVGFSPVITSGLTSPVDIVNAHDGSNRLFMVQQNGIIRVYSGGVLLPTPFLNINSIITFGGERGLLTMAFHPGYASNGYFFVYYNNSAGNVTLAQYRVSAGNANVADAASGKVLLSIPKPFSNHNGCKLLFGPDGNLYFGTGDGGSSGDPQNNAQNSASLLGKMIRINVDNFTTAPYYTVPPSNPFVGVSGYLPEIYATGLRNPWRWCFDTPANDIWIADVGQNAWEEVNRVPIAQAAGANYGWRCYEGNHTYNVSACGATPATGKTFPIFEYPHNATGGFSITGGLVYRGAEFPLLQGYYICCDYVTSNGWLIRPNGTGGHSVYQQTNFPVNIVTYGEAENGTLFAATQGGTVYKVIVTGALPVTLLSFSGRQQGDRDLISWSATVDDALTRYEVEQSADGTRFYTAATQLPATSGNTAHYNVSIIPPAGDVRFYRLKMLYKNGSMAYSGVIKLSGEINKQPTAIFTNRQLQLHTPVPLKGAILYSTTGQKMVAFSNLTAGNHLLYTPHVSSGMYIIRCMAENGQSYNSKVAVP